MKSSLSFSSLAMKWTGLVFGTGLLLGAWSSVAEATIVLQLSDQQMAVKANRIVYGKVVRKYSQWVKKERRIYTYITIAALSHVKGAAKQEVVIRQVGGTANGLGMHVPGSAKFELGEEVFVFLEKSRVSTHHLVMGMSYGKFRVVTDAKTQVKMLQRDLHGVSLAVWDAKKKMHIKHATPEMIKPKPMTTFVTQIQTYLKAATVKTPTLKTPTVKRPTLQTQPRPNVPQPTPKR